VATNGAVLTLSAFAQFLPRSSSRASASPRPCSEWVGRVHFDQPPIIANDNAPPSTCNPIRTRHNQRPCTNNNGHQYSSIALAYITIACTSTFASFALSSNNAPCRSPYLPGVSTLCPGRHGPALPRRVRAAAGWPRPGPQPAAAA
jgi:hypothetical protein